MKHFNYFFFLITLPLFSTTPDPNLKGYHDSAGNTRITWQTAWGYRYQLHTSTDLTVWETEDILDGYGHSYDLLIHEAPGSNSGPSVSVPSHSFFISPYVDGNTLFRWIGNDGETYQTYLFQSLMEEFGGTRAFLPETFGAIGNEIPKSSATIMMPIAAPPSSLFSRDLALQTNERERSSHKASIIHRSS